MKVGGGSGAPSSAPRFSSFRQEDDWQTSASFFFRLVVAEVLDPFDFAKSNHRVPRLRHRPVLVVVAVVGICVMEDQVKVLQQQLLQLHQQLQQLQSQLHHQGKSGHQGQPPVSKVTPTPQLSPPPQPVPPLRRIAPPPQPVPPSQQYLPPPRQSQVPPVPNQIINAVRQPAKRQWKVWCMRAELCCCGISRQRSSVLMLGSPARGRDCVY